MKLNGNKMPSMSVPESMYFMTENKYMEGLKTLRNPPWAGRSLQGLCCVLRYTPDFLGDLAPVIWALYAQGLL